MKIKSKSDFKDF